jgi:hypothetical protein
MHLQSVKDAGVTILPLKEVIFDRYLSNKKVSQKRGLVMLLGRARFELATEELKEVILLRNPI